METTADQMAQKNIEERMNILGTSLKKVEAAVVENENHLEEVSDTGGGGPQGDQGQSDSSEEHEGDVVV